MALVAAGLVLWAPGAWAAEGAEVDPRELVSRGQEEMKAGRFDAALEALLAADEALDHGGIKSLIGVCHEELGQLEAALGYFVRARDSGDLPADAAQSVAERIGRLRERLQSGLIALTVTPDDATVEIDGEVVGSTPIAPRTVAVGSHVVVLRAEGHEPQTRTVEVRGAKTTALTAHLPVVVVEPAASRYEPWTWVSLGTGAALMVGGAVLVALGEDDHQTITSAPGYGTGEPVAMSLERAQQLESSGDTKKLGGWIAVGVGGAAVLTAGILFALDEPAEASGTIVPAVAPLPDGGAFTLRGTF